ncbi:DUF3172 domain-containing protein [Cyanobacterium sp. uoEpiScrs1]|uniref:DUF3172 domain-containing protein n=1 Tax=Cyanobacterium sp. uoEpiScrs1 TaxID=2976343 RepID=UPI002269D837|nr:DUF3172 domain-containing protein [Cyanobacterium sp. uoEpiScrs1]
MARRPRDYSHRSGTPRHSSPDSSGSKFNYANIALLGGVFVLGIGVGIGVSSTASFDPQNVASREVIDKSVPDAELCVQFGASAIVTDMRVFITLNPFSVFVTQPAMQPGCVLRRANMSLLEQQRLITGEQVRDCKNRMNTFGFTGSLETKPEINCIYPNDAAGNLFLNPAGSVTSPRLETDNF